MRYYPDSYYCHKQIKGISILCATTPLDVDFFNSKANWIPSMFCRNALLDSNTCFLLLKGVTLL